MSLIYIIIILLILVLLILTINYLYENHGNKVKLNYRIFKNLYNICPSKWYLRGDCLYYEKQTKITHFPWSEDSPWITTDSVSIKMNFLDYYKMLFFMRHQEKIKKHQKETKELQDVLIDMQRVIEEYKRKGI